MINAHSSTLQYYFRYRLNENCKSESKIFPVNVNLTKEWSIFSNEIVELKPYIRTKDNPIAEIDMEEFDRTTQGVVRSSLVQFKKKYPQYSRDTLASMPRNLLVEICLAYSIPVVNRPKDFLVNRILEKQEIYKFQETERKDEEKKVLLENIAEIKINEILDKRCVGLLNEEKEEIKKEVIEGLKTI
jgi:hypothetical protein